jgi:type II secretory pathway pseudopilin PulG
MKKRHFNAGYSIIEVVAVLVLLIILTGAGIWSVGNVHNTELFGKISQDLARINSSKVAWRTAHPEDAFLPTEGQRFVLLQPYLKSGLLQVDTMSDWEPSSVTYYINDEFTPTTATNSAGQGYNPAINNWYGN